MKKIDKSDITILPADDPKQLKLGWKLEERIGPYYLPSDDNTCYNTDKADKFLGNHGEMLAENSLKHYSFAVIRQLEFLWGQPWNNLALNYIWALRPSAIRVSTGVLTADACSWRVTVLLEEDGRTIKYIEQECNVGCIGAECGHDLALKLSQQKTGRKIPKVDVTNMSLFTS